MIVPEYTGPVLDGRPPEHRCYTVGRAGEGGFVVQGDRLGGAPPWIYFAGTLGDCLAFIERKLTPASEVKSVDVKAAPWQAPHAPKTEGKVEINFPEYEPRRDPEDWPTVWTASQGEAHLRAVCAACDAVATAVEDMVVQGEKHPGVREMARLADYLRGTSRGHRHIRATRRS